MTKFYTNVLKLKDVLHVRYVEDGIRKRDAVKFEPSLFIEDTHGTAKCGMMGEDLREIRFGSMSAAKDALAKHGHLYHGTDDFIAQYIQQEFPGKIAWDQALVRVANIDIEVFSGDAGFPVPEKADHPVDSITIKLSDKPDYYVFTTKEYDETKSELEGLPILAQTFKNERDLLRGFLGFWVHHEPDIVTGWFIRRFDIPYLVNRMQKVIGNEYKKLSPFGWISQKQVAFKGGDMSTYELAGIAIVDYDDAFRKFAYSYPPQESYKLNHIAHVVLGEKKLSYDEYGSLHELGTKNPQKYVDYNIKDVWLVEKLDEKLGLLGLIMTMAYKAGVNYSECFGTTRIWDSIIYRRLQEDGIQCPPKQGGERQSYEGAYVKEPIPGLYRGVVSYDFESLYPSTIVQWNMSYETIVNDGKTLNSTRAANGAHFRKDKQGIIPQIIEEYKAERKAYKKAMLDAKQMYEKTKDKKYDIEKTIANNQQMAVKILINSLYGALANAFFRYYDIRIAEAITLTGQAVNNYAEKAINKYLNEVLKTDGVDYVIAMDTDSDYINLGPLLEKFPKIDGVSEVDLIIKFCERYLEPVIEEALKDFYDQHDCYKPNLRMARDLIAESGIWTAKKRYLLNVLDAEGVRYEKPQLKMVGLEAIKSSTPEKIREWMKEVFPLVLQGKKDDIGKYLDKRRIDFHNLTPEEVGMPTSVNELSKFIGPGGRHISGTPMHVRAAIEYNRLLTSMKLDKLYPLIKDGDKIKVLHLKLPNVTRGNVIAFIDVFPREFQLMDRIDYAAMYEKAFLNPLDAILQAAGMDNSSSTSLEDFFA